MVILKKSNKIQELPGASSPGPPPERCPGPTGGLKAATRPHVFVKQNSSPLSEFIDLPLTIPVKSSLILITLIFQ